MLKVLSLFHILFLVKSICNSHMDRLYIGRIVEGQFEYPELNGWMTPLEAIHICENDEKCAAFTYKVCLTNLYSSSKYEITKGHQNHGYKSGNLFLSCCTKH